jgi:hypothetical protein
MPRVLASALLTALVTIAWGAAASAAATPDRGQTGAHEVGTASDRPRTAPLVFGIYPGGAAGTFGPSGTTRPEDPALRLDALERLRPPQRPFVVRLYVGYGGGRSAEQQVGGQLAAYERAGFQTELVLCYRPADGGSPADVEGFVGFVRASLQSFARAPGFVSLQVTNEANVPGSPNASDGYYRGAEDALIMGVIAAADWLRHNHVTHVRVGFNWAYQTDPAEHEFWSYLGRVGGRRFVDSLDWVGVDAYPGTWGPALGPGDLATATRHFMHAAFTRLRSVYLPLAGIPRSVPLEVCESGYPTGAGRTDAMQVTVMQAAVTEVYRSRGPYNITGYRWFDLRDADSSASSFESRYGILRDDYSPKPAFGVYRSLVAELDDR